MEQEKKKKSYGNIFYGIIGIATLMIATIGATFAYYTASATNNGTIIGNMATVTFTLTVTKVTDADNVKGLIPMSNNMVQQAVSNASTNGICVDNNGNASCQIYKITVVNTGSASMFVDGYVTLKLGSGIPADYTATTSNNTSMRWAQVFCNSESGGKVTGSCTTAGNSTVRPDSGSIAFTALGGASVASSGLNTGEIKTVRTDVTLTQSNGAVIKGNKYEVINRNYIRVSDHVADNYSYSRANDTTSALVYNQYLDPNDANATNNTGTSSSTFTDAQVYYIAVWLSENGHNQTLGATNDSSHGGNASTVANNFFGGNVTFISAQGNEVTATFYGHTRVAPNT